MSLRSNITSGYSSGLPNSGLEPSSGALSLGPHYMPVCRLNLYCNLSQTIFMFLSLGRVFINAKNRAFYTKKIIWDAKVELCITRTQKINRRYITLPC